MVGPFMQGLFLIGIIYWYSKGMMSMINDYYRSEFQRKLQTEPAKAKAEAPINVDNFMDYVRDLDTPDEVARRPADETETGTVHIGRTYCHILLRFLEITGALPPLDVCLTTSNIR
ncbi:uncharacterized protein LOC6553851 [Drosophila erecta]|uniref:GG15753 n=1 Tax=Drosophila erecta TaxID=7220 RepID=B3P067_DROER|nr:uncharacterized protein LOC6553851 [Drosophila erecta]EDV48441.1 uncharacterized protein Dere_GG15753, isoform C [Drosophila erecta]KQS38732.1 uncharacterized protein Dere_GG15753, isoform B [Drosophila erecta]